MLFKFAAISSLLCLCGGLYSTTRVKLLTTCKYQNKTEVFDYHKVNNFHMPIMIPFIKDKIEKVKQYTSRLSLCIKKCKERQQN